MDGSGLTQRPLCPCEGISRTRSRLMIHRKASGCGLGLPRERFVSLLRANSTSSHRAGQVLQRDGCLPFPRSSLGSAAGSGVSQPGAAGSCELCGSNCPEPVTPLPVTDRWPKPRTFLAALRPLRGISNVTLLSLASMWEVINLGVGAPVRGKIPEGGQHGSVYFCGDCWLLFLNNNSLINK